MEYSEAIAVLKERHPELYHERFEITNGNLGYDLRHDVLDIQELQKELNEILGQKEYHGKFVTYRKVYARNESEAKHFLRQESNLTLESVKQI